MKLDEMGKRFKMVEDIVRREAALDVSWKLVLDTTGQSSNQSLASLNLAADAESLVIQVKSILEAEPLPRKTTFLYFGLFDLLDKNSRTTSAGFYIAGGTGDCKQALDDGDLSYFPNHRFLKSRVLNRIKEIARESVESQQLIDYAILFGAAAILSKEIYISLGFHLPLYVGFDSGDYSLISS